MLERIKEEGIEQFLLNLGVAKDSIERSKNDFSLDTEELIMYYDFDKKITPSNFVPVNEISGISRAKGLTFFQIFNDGLYQLNDINVSQFKLLRQLKLLDGKGLNEFQKIYNEKMKIPFMCFKKGQEIKYFQANDGNHRCILAKVTGLKTIGSNSIEIYNFNEKKYRLYRAYQNTFFQLKETVQNTDFIFQDDMFDTEFRLFIDYRFNSQYIKLDILKNLSFPHPLNEDEYMSEEKKILELIARLKKIKMQTAKYIKKYKRYPKFYLSYMKVQKKYKYELNDMRISQLIALKSVLEM